MKSWSFKHAGLLLVCCFVLQSVPAQQHGWQLDFRAHRGYEGWERTIPTHAKAQYAGGMGFLSFGGGWDYGRKCRWETDVMIGVLPGSCSDRTHTTFTLRQNYIPWSIRCCERFAIEPFACGLYFTLISGEDYWVREPDRYPGSGYYTFTSRLRSYLYVGQRFTYYLQHDGPLRDITLYYEFSANDLDLIAKCANRSLGLADMVYFSFGIKFQLLR
ncbi:MAG: hypothetical protein NC209_04635 [Alistipes sp.]|nr:hypothetical protein [Alistipes senegalensis]MCM1250412.1 hypothetical protein [Alistipes sp.]